MRLNQKVHYAVACLLELAKAGSVYTETEWIARRQEVPLAFAHKILQALAHAGLVHAAKGCGYKLARPLEHITAYELIAALTKEPHSATKRPSAAELFEQRVNRALETVTLAEMQVRP